VGTCAGILAMEEHYRSLGDDCPPDWREGTDAQRSWLYDQLNVVHKRFEPFLRLTE
jgi:hypothetical protein